MRIWERGEQEGGGERGKRERWGGGGDERDGRGGRVGERGREGGVRNEVGGRGVGVVNGCSCWNEVNVYSSLAVAGQTVQV